MLIRMQHGLVRWAVAVTLLAVVAGSALRPTKEYGGRRTGRRLTSTSQIDNNEITSPSSVDNVEVSSFSPRSSRQRESGRSSTNTPRKYRFSTLSVQTTTPIISEQTERTTTRRSYSRTRSKPLENVTPENTTPINQHRDRSFKQKSRQSSRGATPAPSSSNNNETKIEVISSNLDEITKMVFNDDKASTNQFRRRTSGFRQSTKRIPTKDFTPQPLSNSSVDLTGSGTTNSVSVLSKYPPSAQAGFTERSSKKLRYKTRLSETDSNETGKGILPWSGVTLSSQTKEMSPSQPDIRTTPIIVAEADQSTESIKSTTTRITKVVKRPVSRGKVRQNVSNKGKTKPEEINEDDNYPASFKAFLQAKNASTTTSSPSRESLSVKASQKIYKTYTSSQQSVITAPDKLYNNSRQEYWSKDKTENSTEVETTVIPLSNVSSESRNSSDSNDIGKDTDNGKIRPKFSRSRNIYTRNKAATIGNVSSVETKPSTEKPAYKFQRKFKSSSTVAPKTESNNFKRSQTNSLLKKSLPRSSFYSRSRNATKPEANSTTTTLKPPQSSSTESSDNNHSSTKRRPTYNPRKRNRLSSTTSGSLSENVEQNTVPAVEKTVLPLLNSISAEDKPENRDEPELFVFSVNPKINQESNGNSDTDTTINTEKNLQIIRFVVTTPRYHSSYKDTDATEIQSSTEEMGIASVLPIKSTQAESSQKPSALKSTDSVWTKFDTGHTKPVTQSTNGITQEPGKAKSRFSSRYRAPHADKSMYKPTVPSVTPSTAWLKFYVTDRELLRTVQPPLWLDDEPYNLSARVPEANTFTTSRPGYQDAMQLAEGDDNNIGPNSITITKTRTTLDSEDLRLSESLMNVEASNHSPSVTVSIFDALADILTSTPRPKISSTTDVSHVTKDAKTNNGVSSDNNVNNNFRGLSSLNTFMSTRAITQNNAQSIEKTTPIVNNSIETTVTTPNILAETIANNPIPLTTTPVSARKPFAVKLLYANTESTDLTLPTVPVPSETLSTDKPTTVYNSVSDLLISNNNLVSSELTSMLSNNIIDILKDMDVKTNPNIPVNMAKLLKSLIPRALVNVSNKNGIVDESVATTPYTLEDIKDTEIIDTDVNSNLDQSGIFQNGTAESVVNSPGSNSVNNLDITTEQPPATYYQTGVEEFVFTTSPIVSTVDVVSTESENVLVPSLTTSQYSGFIPETTENIVSVTTEQKIRPNPLSNRPSTLIPTLDSDLPTEYPKGMSPIQLWILSQKARVLKMIEDLLQRHNEEIKTVTSVPSSFSRPSLKLLPLKINTDSPKTDNDNDTTDIPLTTTPTHIPPTTQPPPFKTIMNLTSTEPTTEAIIKATGTPTTASAAATTETPPSSINENDQTTTPVTDVDSVTVDVKIRFDLESTEATVADATTETHMMTETTTVFELNTDTTTDSSSESPTTVIMQDETTTESIKEKVESNKTSSNFVFSSTPPKKDYVIFGILPNNTVVRKNPNEDILETLTESTPYIVYGVLPNNTIIRKFPNGTRVPRVMQKVDVLPISPWSLRNPYSPIHNIPAIVRPPPNRIQVSTNVMTTTDTNNGTDNNTFTDTVNNQQVTVSPILNVKDSYTDGVFTTTTNKPLDKSTASHVLSLRTSTMLPSVDEILLNSISSAAKEEMFISSMTSSTHQPRILTLDIDPETKQIRTEKPSDGSMNAVFKFIPIDEVTTSSQNSNVLKLATKTTTTQATSTDSTTGSSQLETNTDITEKSTVTQKTETMPPYTNRPLLTTETITSELSTEKLTTIIPTTNIFTTASVQTSKTEQSKTTANIEDFSVTEILSTTREQFTTTTEPMTLTTEAITAVPIITTTVTTRSTTTEPANTEATKSTENLSTQREHSTESTTNRISVKNEIEQIQDDAKFLQALLQATGRDPKSLNLFDDKLLNSIPKNSVPDKDSLQKNIRPTINTPSTTASIEDDIKQFQEDAKLLQALLQATGQNPNILNIPDITTTPITTTARQTRPPTTTAQVDNRFEEDARLLEAFLKATSKNTVNLPTISKATSSVRLSNTGNTPVYTPPTTTSTPKAVLTTSTTTELPTTEKPTTTQRTTTTETPTTTERTTTQSFSTTLQLTTGNPKISTTYPPYSNPPRRPTVPMGRRAPSGFTMTTEMPSTSTFSVQEDLQFLQNLKSVLNTNANDDPEAQLANRIIALAVEKSLTEIKTKPGLSTTQQPRTTTTTTTTTTTARPTTTLSTPSIEEDIKQFQEDTKLLQALLQATGQDPSKFNIPTITTPNVRINAFKVPPAAQQDLSLLSNLLSSPSPLNEPFEPITRKPNTNTNRQRLPSKPSSSPRPYGAKIAVNGVKTTPEDSQLLQTLVKLQGVQGPSTVQNVLITGQTSDQALKQLLPKTKVTGMVSEATQSPMSVSSEYGKSNDALLAALLKEQGFGPTTATSLDEQIRLAALLNQVVVTPKARRTTTTPPPPPPPPPRRPVLDGLAWLWQQWRETAPGPPQSRPNRRPNQMSSASSAATSTRLNMFGSGPFVGNAEDRPTSNRIPLEPPRAVAAEQTPARGQLVSAAINVTRAFSQFLGAAIQGAAQTVQNVIRAGQRAANDVYTNGSGSG